LKTFKEQQRKDNDGPYSFQRKTSWATDGVPLGGYGYPTKKIGLIHSMFRPSDDATVYPFLIPSNLFAWRMLTYLNRIADNGFSFSNDLFNFSEQIKEQLNMHSIIEDKNFGKVFAYEING